MLADEIYNTPLEKELVFKISSATPWRGTTA